MVLEAERTVGTATSSRNSEVIHAGIYYAAGSLKARLCIEGKGFLYRYCAERGVAHARCGKLIVATSEAQLATLETIRVAGADGYVVLLQAEQPGRYGMMPGAILAAAQTR